MISIENLVKRHGSREVLHGVSLEARPGRVTGFVGPNLTRDSLVGFRWLGVSFRCYCGVGGLVVGH